MRILTAAMLLGLAANANAQLPNEEYRGVTAVGLALRELASTKRVLMIAAHPDDEDSHLISALRLGQGAEVAYLSLTRGEGGQNSIGSELGPALGILRTGEMLAARQLDRAQQYFTRAYDFGFSKSADETLQHWPRDSVLADVVSVVRRYRPDIIVAIFTGTPADGHGHHQVSALLAREAFAAAADPNRFPEQMRAGLRPHRTLKFFQSANFSGSPTHRLATGTLDPLIGRSYSQIAWASRSRHRSQDTGAPQVLGPRSTAVRIVQSLVGHEADSSLFAGIDTTLSAKAGATRENAATQRAVEQYDSLLAVAKNRLSPYHTSEIVPLLAAAVRDLEAAHAAARDPELRSLLASKQTSAEAALLRAAGVVVDALSSTELVIPGEAFNLDVTVWNAGRDTARIAELAPLLPPGWSVQRTDSAGDVVAPGTIAVRRFSIQVPATASISQPYFLAKPRVGDAYAWPSGNAVAGLPFDSAQVRISGMLDVAGVSARVGGAATRRLVDPRQGELRRPVHVVPAFALAPSPQTAVVTHDKLAAGANRGIAAAIEARSNGRGGSLLVKPSLPAGWTATPAQASMSFSGPDQRQTASFSFEAPRNVAAGVYTIAFVATDERGRSFNLTQHVVDHPHIVNRVWYEPALMQVRVLDARIARGMRVAYVVGLDAAVPPVLEQLGITVDQLDADGLAKADLSKYDAIIVGSRAYEVRPDLVANNGRILDYGRAGGNVVVLYQQYGFIQGNFAPYPLTLSRPADRITDEHATVRFLDPGARLLRSPNQITARDFDDWLQERTLYMPHTWAPEYTPLLEMADPGEAPKQGAIVTAPLGAGTYTYTGIPFFREIPAAVPGVLRLFINLLSLGLKDAAL